MQKTLYLLLSLLLTHAINASDDKDALPLTSVSNSTQMATLLTLIKQGNETISPNDGVVKRWTRNITILWNDPCAFCATERKEHENILKNYIMDQKFTINGEGIFTALGVSTALQMKEEFEKDQISEIKRYQQHRSETYSCECPSGLACCILAFPTWVLALGTTPLPVNYIAGPAAGGLCCICATCLAAHSER